jgi:phosphoglycolate phosphatase
VTHWYRRRVPVTLVLWDVDYTLVDAGGVGRQLYDMAFSEMFGGDFPGNVQSMAGRTDTAIALEVLTLAGVAEPDKQLEPFRALLASRAAGLADLVRERARVLPGAAEALAALALRQRDGQVVQSLLTGNLPELAEVKLTALGLTTHLDLACGAYGDASRVRADLVPIARGKAAKRYGHDFSGAATVLIGDTPSDIEAALLNAARGIGVATGSFTQEELAAAGAHAVLPDLSQTGRTVAAILGQPDG